MVEQHPLFLNEREVLFHRMESFHRERIQAFTNGSTPLKDNGGGILVVHVIPESSVVTRIRFDATKLKEHGRPVHALGDRGGYSRFNVDGWINYDGQDHVRGYSQIYRDGRLEAAMSDATYPTRPNDQNSIHVLRDGQIEKAVIALVSSYLAFCKSVDLQIPIWLFSALIDCKGVRFCVDWSFQDVSDHDIDRSPCYLPEIEITSLDAEPMLLMRPWCDTLWQSCGMERSFNFDQDGNWRERRR